MRKLMFVIFVLFTFVILAAQVRANERVALVIGNAEYKHAPALANPLNDAGDIGAALGRLGFMVTRLDNADYDAMRRGLRAFTRAASTAEVALVFYAGHGIEVDKRNFLIPVDARLQSDREVEFETVSLDLVSRAVEGASGLGLVILDACRDNPFTAAMKRSGAKRSIGRGLARVEPSGETLVAYAAKGGSVAADGRGRNSPYTTALLAHVEEPGLEVGLMFRKVRDAVLQKTNGQQEPFVYGSLSSKGFYFSAPTKTVPVAPRVVDTPVVKSDEQLFWESVKGSRDPADLKAYLKQYPGGAFAMLAHNRIKRLSQPKAQTRGATEAVEAAIGLKRSERRRIQIALGASGFDTGGRDGLFGPRTRAAIAKWQASLGKAKTGYLDTKGAMRLLEVAPDASGGVWAIAAKDGCKLWNPSPMPGEKVSWKGACRDGKASGKGRAVWKTARGEETYEGEYRQGRRHGRGYTVWRDGRIYDGEWRNGKRHGQGLEKSADASYEGMWKNDRKHGRGVRKLADGTRYEGEWRNGRMPDRGVIKWPNGNRYEGEWQDGKPHGRGKITLARGGRYEGEFRLGKKHGQGIDISSNGERYEGEFRDDKAHGRGIWTYRDGQRYEGEWHNDKRHGKGIQTWANGNRYEGEWQDGERYGRGTMTLANGDRYEGEYRNGKRHGRGIYYYAGGPRYEGEYRDDKLHGPGILFDKSGRKVAEGNASSGCFGSRGSWNTTFGATPEECGFK